jgi:hypothetical protein
MFSFLFDNLFVTFIHIIFITGAVGLIIGFLLGFIPIVNQYKVPIQIISLVLFSVGLWFEGRIAKDNEWRIKLAEVEAKLLEARVQAEKASVQVVTKVVKEKQIIKEKGRTITEYIDREIIKYDPMCPIPTSVLSSHNAAATNDTSLLNPDAEVSTKDHNSLAKPKLRIPSEK